MHQEHNNGAAGCTAQVIAVFQSGIEADFSPLQTDGDDDEWVCGQQYEGPRQGREMMRYSGFVLVVS